MGTINISSAEEIIYKDFTEGNSVQVRVTVPPHEGREYQKGKKVKVVFGKEESDAKIVSDPLVVQAAEEGKETLSLIVEKAK